MEQQHEASTLGMWVFLVTEVMFFGGLFMAYIALPARGTRWRSARAATTSTCGSAGSTPLVLICSSLTMALAVRAAQVGNRKGRSST
jgi:cytochrome c oxidase subunit III